MAYRETSVPPSHPTLLTRGRLTERLRRRFEVRLMIITGGGGSGKTTALTQAMTAEADHVDIWYSCSTPDRDPSRLLSGLIETCQGALSWDVPRSAGPSADVLAELLLAASPRQVCLILDDAHLLTDPLVLDELLRLLPTNAHVLLAGRRRPAVSTARLDAAKRFDEISQDELLMTSDELIEFANLRGVDVRQLEGAEGWPAFVELASFAQDGRSRRYLEEEAVRSLAPARRRALAAFAVVGGGDDELAYAVTDVGLTELLADLPLVRWIGEEAKLHDLWSELLGDELIEAELVAAAMAASEVYRERGAFDRAAELGVLVEAWDDVARTLGEAVRQGVNGGLRADQLKRWRVMLPAETAQAPVGILIEGLIARERDPTTDVVRDLLDRAARGFAAEASPALELVALVQLGYVSRIAGEPGPVLSVRARVATLAERHPEAHPFLAFFDAWHALVIGRPDLQVAALDEIANVDLPTAWKVSRDHLRSNALVNLGRPAEGLRFVPQGMHEQPVPIPGPLVTESQCLWHSGRPELALALQPKGLAPGYGARDRFIGGSWIGMMHAWAGDVDAAQTAVEIAKSSIGAQPGALVSAQLFGVELLIRLAKGDEATAMVGLAQILELAPLGEGVSEQMLRSLLALPYVGVAASRTYWDNSDHGPAAATAREIARAFVRAREDADLRSISELRWPEPGTIAAVLPVRWAVEFSLFGVLAGRHAGRLLAAWLCENWGEPARAALRSWTDDITLGETACDVLSHTPSPPEQDLSVRILGQANLEINGHESPDPDWRRERVRSLLVLLTLRPNSSRDTLAGSLWPDLTIDRALKNLRTTLNYLHNVLEPQRSAGDATWYVRVDGPQVSLQSELWVDLWEFRRVLDEADEAERLGRPNKALPLLLQAIALWRGDFAEDLDHNWLDLERIHLRSRFVRASCRAAELLVATENGAKAIEVLRPALVADPWHERAYLALTGAYESIGDVTAARSVADLAESQLGHPLGRPV